jgi:hypothetical protein
MVAAAVSSVASVASVRFSLQNTNTPVAEHALPGWSILVDCAGDIPLYAPLERQVDSIGSR